MPHNVSPPLLDDIQVRELNGLLKKRWMPDRVDLDINISVGVDTDRNRASLDVSLDATGYENDEDREGSPMFSGSVKLHLVPSEGYSFADQEEPALSILDSGWSAARTSLTDHANRLGVLGLKIPPVLDGHVSGLDRMEPS